ncbi:hypothetical protein PMIN06_004858 [Paraphaeosphaeria minitans]
MVFCVGGDGAMHPSLPCTPAAARGTLFVRLFVRSCGEALWHLSTSISLRYPPHPPPPLPTLIPPSNPIPESPSYHQPKAERYASSPSQSSNRNCRRHKKKRKEKKKEKKKKKNKGKEGENKATLDPSRAANSLGHAPNNGATSNDGCVRAR